jgi:hypothetical protein
MYRTRFYDFYHIVLSIRMHFLVFFYSTLSRGSYRHEMVIDHSIHEIAVVRIGVHPRRHTRSGHEKRMVRITERLESHRPKQILDSENYQSRGGHHFVFDRYRRWSADDQGVCAV